jgi:non-specific serine/threonine protein kinase/serine/threonine-protein kinase
MGVVWLAEQAKPVRRKVAVKIIKAGMDSSQVVARFEAERQALALMDHPGIAHVFEAGTTDQGRPYFAMEYVRGEPITAYCALHKLSLHARLDIFLQVCDAIQHAHQKGIIHRDLKPSNVLVMVQGDHPVPKIIDFGVAKAMSQSLTERTLLTELGTFIGTPEYMSPEQAEMSGLDVDTRTDVYSLGAMLYELLTGSMPFDSKTLREKSLDEMRRMLREMDPPKPSTRVATKTELRGDLDWITMKALEKDRTRRYGSASDLAADLRRHLDNQPVLAGPPSTRYRVGKFIRRHRGGAASAAAAVVLLVGFSVAMAAQARQLAHARDRANDEAQRANREAAAATQVSDFLVGLFNVSDPSESRGNTLTAREVLDKGAQRIDQTLAHQPAIQGRLLGTIGGVYTGLGLYREAESLLRRAIDLDERSLGADHADTLEAVNRLANVYWFMGRYTDAEPLYLRVVDSRRRTLGADNRATLRARYDLASSYVLENRQAEAERLLVDTLEVQRRKFGDEDSDTLLSMHNLASLYHKERRYAESATLNEEVFKAQQRTLGSDHPETLNTQHNLGTDYYALQRYPEAEKIFVDTLKVKRRVLGVSHPRTGRTESLLGLTYIKLQRYADAEPLLLEAYNTTGDGDLVRRGEYAAQLADLYDAWGKPGTAAEWRAIVANRLLKAGAAK